MDSQAKLLTSMLPKTRLRPAKPLNPRAEEFHRRLPLLPYQVYGLKSVEQVVKRIHPILPHQIYDPRNVGHGGEHTEPPPVLEPVSPQEMWRPYFYDPCQAMFLPDLTWGVTVYSPPLPFSSYQPLGSGFYDTSLHQRKTSMAEERTERERPGRRCMERRPKVGPAPKRDPAKWRVKEENKNTSNTGVRPVSPFPATFEEAERSGITTVMIKNVPNQFR